jgi:leucine-rich repeat protein SHOC2
LQSFNMNANQISSISDDISNLAKVKTISLIDNKITTLPTSMSRMTELKMINLKGNPISDTEKEKIKKDIPKARLIF